MWSFASNESLGPYIQKARPSLLKDIVDPSNLSLYLSRLSIFIRKEISNFIMMMMID